VSCVSYLPCGEVEMEEAGDGTCIKLGTIAVLVHGRLHNSQHQYFPSRTNIFA
jgi:hypothetical protein